MNEVLDASALLVWLQGEPGADEVRLEDAYMNSVNWSEVLQKANQRGVATASLREELEVLGLRFGPFTVAEGARAAELWPATRPLGLSLADRACLATALVRDAVAVTADRAWSRVEGVRVRRVR